MVKVAWNVLFYFIVLIMTIGVMVTDFTDETTPLPDNVASSNIVEYIWRAED